MCETTTETKTAREGLTLTTVDGSACGCSHNAGAAAQAPTVGGASTLTVAGGIDPKKVTAAVIAAGCPAALAGHPVEQGM